MSMILTVVLDTKHEKHLSRTSTIGKHHVPNPKWNQKSDSSDSRHSWSNLSCKITGPKNRAKFLSFKFQAKCHIVNRLFNDVVISQEALMGLTEGRMMRFNYGVENHAEINGPGSYVVLDIFPTDSESDGYDSDSSRGIPPKE